MPKKIARGQSRAGQTGKGGELYGGLRLGDRDEVIVEPHPSRAKVPGPRIVVMFPGEDIKQFSGVIVFTWDKVVNPRERSGSKYRKYCEAFTQEERQKLGTWHTKMYGWEMRTGHPGEIGMTMATYDLLRRAANFFASI